MMNYINNMKTNNPQKKPKWLEGVRMGRGEGVEDGKKNSITN